VIVNLCSNNLLLGHVENIYTDDDVVVFNRRVTFNT